MSTDPESPIFDPNGPPVSNRVKWVVGTVSGGMIVFLGSAVVLLLAALTPTRTMGALRSQRVKWEERRSQIIEVQAESDAAMQDAGTAQEGGQTDE